MTRTSKKLYLVSGGRGKWVNLYTRIPGNKVIPASDWCNYDRVVTTTPSIHEFCIPWFNRATGIKLKKDEVVEVTLKIKRLGKIKTLKNDAQYVN